MCRIFCIGIILETMIFYLDSALRLRQPRNLDATEKSTIYHERYYPDVPQRSVAPLVKLRPGLTSCGIKTGA